METSKTEDVKACFRFIARYWEELRKSRAKLPQSVLLRFQRACNMFTRRISNNQDAEDLGDVLIEVAKMLPFNDKAGINALFVVNQHETPMDTEAGVSNMLLPLPTLSPNAGLPFVCLLHRRKCAALWLQTHTCRCTCTSHAIHHDIALVPCHVLVAGCTGVSPC